jgi:hypothetical protein
MSFANASIRGTIADMTTSKKKEQAARDRLTELGAVYTARKTEFDDAKRELDTAIVEILKARTLGPSEVTRHVPYERNHVGRVAKDGGVPPLREGTVVSKKQAAGEDPSG